MDRAEPAAACGCMILDVPDRIEVDMRSHRFFSFAAAAFLALGVSPASAQSPWSGSVHTGLVFSGVGRHGGGVTTGAWIDGLHSIAPNWAAGVEVGYVHLPSADIPYYALNAAGYSWFGGGENSSHLFSASGVVRGRSAGPMRVHLVTTFGYYEVASRYIWGTDEYQKLPGFSLALGVSGSGLVAPMFQLRWHEVIRPHNDYMDVVSFEAGLRFN